MNLRLENIVLLLTVATGLGVLSFDSKCPPLKLVSGRSRYQWRGRSVRFNCMRSFQLVGVKYATCMNGKWDAKVPICVKYGCRVPSTTHVNGQLIESYRGAVVKIVCNPGYSLIGSPSVYCNGIRWNETFPVCRALNLNPALSCGFEEDELCGWSQDPMHDFDWHRRNDSPPGSAPSDRPKGNYMYIESSPSRTENDTARLFSPVYRPSNRSCFLFWYRASGMASGFLKVYVKPENLELWNVIPSFWINTDQGDSWKQGYFLIEPTESPFQIVVEGSRGPHDLGTTALDDVRLTSPEECVFLENLSSSTETASSYSTEEDTVENMTCRNRCNEEKNATALDPYKCYCYSTCDRDNNCCPNYLELCVESTTATAESTTQTDAQTSSSTSSPPTPPSVPPDKILPPPKPSPNHFNNESNDIDPHKPLPPALPPTTPTRTPNETQKQHRPNTPPTKPPKSTTPPPRPKTTTPRKDTPKVATNTTKVVLPKPPANRTKTQKAPDEPPRRESPPGGRLKPEVVVKSTSVTSTSTATTPARAVKKSNPNSIKLTFPEKPSRPNLSNESRFPKGKPKELSGKEPPQAIKIEGSEGSGGVPVREIAEFGGTALAVLAAVVVGFVVYRKRESRKSERDNMVEDSDSILYETDSSAVGSEYHSLVCIRPGGLAHSL